MLIVTYVPMQRNDGSKVSRRELNEILDGALVIAGGCSVSGPVRGLWVGAEKTYDEKNYRVEIVCSAEQVTEIREWVVEMGRRLGQEAMYFEVRDTPVEIITIN